VLLSSQPLIVFYLGLQGNFEIICPLCPQVSIAEVLSSRRANVPLNLDLKNIMRFLKLKNKL